MLPLALASGGAGLVVLVVASRRRRRGGHEGAGQDTLPAGLSPLGSLALATASRGDVPPPPSGPAIALPATDPDEAQMPRWRRPSLMQARLADPRRAGERIPIRFDGTTESPDRRIVRYDLARLTDAPDEVRGRELALVGRGDEVVVLEQLGAYLRVRTPDGLEGWIHRTIVGKKPKSPAAPAMGQPLEQLPPGNPA